MIVSASLFAAALLLAPATMPSAAGPEDVAKIVAECVEKMNHEDWEVRGQGERKLVELGGKAIPHLEKILAEKGDTLKRRDDVQETLQDLQIQVAEKEIRKLFPADGGNPGTFDDQMKPVIEALGDRAEAYLLLVLKDVTRESTIRTLAAAGIADLKKESSIPGLESVWKDEWESQQVRRAAAQALDRLGKTGPMDELIARAEKVLAESASNPQAAVQACFDLAALHRTRSEHPKVVEYYKKAAKMSPGAPIIEYNLACAYAVWGKKAEALDALERSVASGYTDVAWMTIDGDLKSLHEEERFVALVAKLEGAK